MLATTFVIMIALNIRDSKEYIVPVLDVAGAMLADRGTASLAFSDVESANSNLRTLSSHDSVVCACIRSQSNQLFSECLPNVEKLYRCEGCQALPVIHVMNNR